MAVVVRSALLACPHLRQRLLRVGERAAPEGALVILLAVSLLVRGNDLLDRVAQVVEHLGRELRGHTSARDVAPGPRELAIHGLTQLILRLCAARPARSSIARASTSSVTYSTAPFLSPVYLAPTSVCGAGSILG